MRKNLVVFLAVIVWLAGAGINLNAQGLKSPQEAFTPELTGFMYYKLDATSGNDKANGFDISRVYIGGKYALDDNFTFRYVSDIGHDTGGGKFSMYTKYAYLAWKLNDKATLNFGQQGTKNFNVVESAWGYRGIRKAPMESFGDFYGGQIGIYTAALDSRIATLSGGSATDQQLADKLSAQKATFTWASRGKIGSSADQGINLSIKPNGNTYIDLMVINGTGYKKAEDDKYKNFQVRIGHYMADKKVHLSAFFEDEPWSYTSGATKYSKSNQEWDLMLSFSAPNKGLLGFDYNGKKFAGSYENITTACFSVFGNVNLGNRKDLKLVSRFDYYGTGFNSSAAVMPGSPDLKTNASLFIAGLDYNPNKRVHIIPDIQVLSYQNSGKKAATFLYLHMIVGL